MDFLDFIKSNKFLITLISMIINILLLISTVIMTYLYLNKECPNTCDNVALETNANEVEEKYHVEVKGEVTNPGVYEVSSTGIIDDVITLAGGFTKNAYTSNINLSRKISNELVIYVYSKDEYKKSNSPKVVVVNKCETSTYDISNCTENKQSEIVASDKDTNFASSSSESDNKTSTTSKIVNINTASKEELDSLPGIGPAKATEIINYRNTSGNFSTIEDIKKVSGIGDALFEKIKNYITV